MSGIDRSSGHIGAAQATRMRSNIGSVGQSAFSMGDGAGLRTSISRDAAARSAIGSLRDEANQGTVDMQDKAASNMADAQMEQFIQMQKAHEDMQKDALRARGVPESKIDSIYRDDGSGSMARAQRIQSELFQLQGGSGGSGGVGGVGSVGGSGGNSAIGALTNEANAGTVDMQDKAAANMKAAQQNQMDMFFLQQAVNTQSQTYNTLSNVQKSKHDAAMAAIQNTR